MCTACPLRGKTVRSIIKSRRSRATLLAAAAATTLCAGVAAPLLGANITDTWLNAVDGTWSDATNWSAGVPNNGADTFSVVIGAVGASYTSTVNSTFTINDLTLNSSSATLRVASGTLSVVNSAIDVAAGTLSLDGGVISGGSISLGGTGTIVFSGNNQNRLSGTTLNGDLNLSSSSGRVRLQNGAMFTGGAATLSSNSNVLAFEQTVTLNGKTINIDGVNDFVSIEGNNTLTIGAGSSIRGKGTLGQALFIGGANGVINNGSILADLAANTLTVNPDSVINNGSISAAAGATLNLSSGVIQNAGTISAAAPSAVVKLGQFNSNWTNQTGGVINVSNGGLLTADGTWTNSGSIIVNNGTLNLDGTFSTASVTSAHLSRTGGTINLSGFLVNAGSSIVLDATTGDWIVNGGAISGGSITASGGNLVFSSNNSNRLTDNAIYNGDLILDQSSGRVRLQSGAMFSGGAATLSSTSNVLAIEQTTTLTGKTINLTGTSGFLTIEGSNTLTIDSTSTVRGRGTVGQAIFIGGTNVLVNNGLISADIAGGSLTVNPAQVNNNGTFAAINGATLSISAGNFSNSATFQANSSSNLNVGQFNSSWTNTPSGLISGSGTSTITTNGTWTNQGQISINNSTLNLSGTFSTASVASTHLSRSGGTVSLSGFLDNTGTMLLLDSSSGDWTLNGGVINDGSISTSGANLIFSGNNNNRLANNALYVGDLVLDQPSGRVRLQTGATFSGGAATLSSSSNVLAIEQTMTLTGKTINLVGSNDFLSLEGNNTLTIGSTSVVRGRGTVGQAIFVGGTNAFFNNGLISADIASTGLNVNPNNLNNSGTMQAINGASLSISAGSFSNSGTLAASNNATLTVGQFNSSWTNTSSGLISGSSGATVTTNGNWSNAGSISIDSARLNLGGTFSTASVVSAHLSRNGGTVNLTGFLDNSGTTLLLNATTGDWFLDGGVISDGSIGTSGARLVFADDNNNRLANNALYVGDLLLDQPSGRVRLQSGATFSGGAATLSSSSNVLGIEQTTTLTGKTINMVGTNDFLSIDGVNSLTIGSNSLVRGRGTVGQAIFVGGGNALINNGTISADISSGLLTLNPNVLTNNGTLEAANGGTLSLGTFTNGTGSLHAKSGGQIVVTHLDGNLNNLSADGLNTLIRVDGTYTINQPIAVTNRATLNLKGNWTRSADIDASGRIIFDYPTAGPSVYSAIKSAIISGRNGGAWNGSGINSSAAASTLGTAVGYAEASDALGPTGGHFSGENVDGTAVLVRYTYAGDSNLDGQVDVTDLGALATNWQASADWIGGDFNYDGFVDVTDLGLLATSWQQGVGNPLGPASFQAALDTVGLGNIAVPEPTGLGIAGIVLTAASATSRRRRLRAV